MILVDYSQVCLATYFVNSEKDGSIEPDFYTHLILNSVKTINKKYRSQYGRLVICCDGLSSWRKKVFPYYKAARKKNRDQSTVNWEPIFATMEKVRSDLNEYFPYSVIKVNSAEADDVIATLCTMYKEEDNLIISADKDFIQLQAYTNVKQYDVIGDKWVTADDPKDYLFRHIMSGDRGDGVPNVLSDDDTFMIEGKRQKTLGDKKIDQWKSIPLAELFTEEDQIQKYNRNKVLIDLRQCPREIKLEINNQYQESLNSQNNVYNYLTSNKLVKLLENIKDFS